MAISKILASITRRGPNDESPETPVHTERHVANEKEQEAGADKPDNDADDTKSEAVTENAQNGVQEVEATTLAWSKAALITVFILFVERRSPPPPPLSILTPLAVCGSSTSPTASSPKSLGHYSLLLPANGNLTL